MSTTDSEPTSEFVTDDYDEMLASLETAIEEVTDKIESGRIRNPEHEKVRVKYYRALGYLVRTKQDLVESKTLEELAVEVEEMKTDTSATGRE